MLSEEKGSEVPFVDFYANHVFPTPAKRVEEKGTPTMRRSFRLFISSHYEPDLLMMMFAAPE